MRQAQEESPHSKDKHFHTAYANCKAPSHGKLGMLKEEIYIQHYRHKSYASATQKKPSNL